MKVWPPLPGLDVRLASAFKELRKRGYLAKQAFRCCQSCAGYELAVEAEQKVSDGKIVRGAVFYHLQDYADRKAGGDFYVSYGKIETQNKGDIGLENGVIGDEVAEVFRTNAILFEWSGNPNERILIKQRSLEFYGHC